MNRPEESEPDGFSVGGGDCYQHLLPSGASTPSTVASSSDLATGLVFIGEVVSGLVYNKVKGCNLCRHGPLATFASVF
jgi:hypothetical protein